MKKLRSVLKKFAMIIPIYRVIEETRNTPAPVTLGTWFFQKVIGINREAYWPMHFTSKVGCAHNILAGLYTAPGLSPGCYIQGIGKISIGDYTLIGPNVTIISANHDLYDNRKHIQEEVHIGKSCWIGSGAVILPGVKLGDFTIVGAGSVVTRSYVEGYAVIAGNPAREIKKLEKQKCIQMQYPKNYFGYIPEDKFFAFRKKHLSV